LSQGSCAESKTGLLEDGDVIGVIGALVTGGLADQQATPFARIPQVRGQNLQLGVY